VDALKGAGRLPDPAKAAVKKAPVKAKAQPAATVVDTGVVAVS
jgi:hypothetical protein